MIYYKFPGDYIPEIETAASLLRGFSIIAYSPLAVACHAQKAIAIKIIENASAAAGHGIQWASDTEALMLNFGLEKDSTAAHFENVGAALGGHAGLMRLIDATCERDRLGAA